MDSSNIESLISDLAFILLLAAVVTVVFKLIRQPVVLGYIVAGFLASPHFTPLPSVTTEANIEFWAQLGIIVLLFSLGLEFSFRKLLNAGGSAVITALINVAGMMGTGYVIGSLMGFSMINSLFLGGMLSMSSTTIIIKAFTDLGLRQRKFAGLVFAVLIVEDLYAVLMMVLLSSIAINNSVESSELLWSISKLVFFLVIWFLVGVYVIPTLLNKARRFLNNETLLVVSMGLCLGMAVFSVYCGFSLALGAFVMGSILAGTSLAERIERVTMPVKDLFGSIFFISVGMMVQPEVILQYSTPILILSLTVMTGPIIFGTFGMLLTGQPLKIAMESGFSLTQIGEFAFIIATLGMSLGVLEPSIYPIVVAVSVLTTFTTPYFIRMADPAYRRLEPRLPKKLHFLIDRYSEDAGRSAGGKRVWSTVLRRYLWRILLYSIVLIAIIIVSQSYFMPWLTTLMSYNAARAVGVIVTLTAMSPFLLALSLPTSRDNERAVLQRLHSHYIVPRVVMTVIRFMIALAFVVHVIGRCYSYSIGIIIGVAIIVMIVIILSTRLGRKAGAIESTFMNNLNERELRRSGKNNTVVSDLHLAYMTVGYGSPFVGQRLMDSEMRTRYGVNVVAIQRGDLGIPVPDGSARLFPGDVIGVIGTDDQIEAVIPDVERAGDSGSEEYAGDFAITSVVLNERSPLLGLDIATADIRRNYQVLILSLQRGDTFRDDLTGITFEPGDILWAVGDPHNVSTLR